jgi:predicted nucleic acid-binding protein
MAAPKINRNMAGDDSEDSVPQNSWIASADGMANALFAAHRRARISTAFRHQAIERLTRLPIAVDLETNTRAWTSTLALAEKTELSVYDASYLELAIRLNVPLASADRKLCHAGKRAGVPLIATA